MVVFDKPKITNYKHFATHIHKAYTRIIANPLKFQGRVDLSITCLFDLLLLGKTSCRFFLKKLSNHQLVRFPNTFTSTFLEVFLRIDSLRLGGRRRGRGDAGDQPATGVVQTRRSTETEVEFSEARSDFFCLGGGGKKVEG